MRGFIVLLLLLAPLTSYGEIYRWTDANGRVHFGEQPGPAAEAIEVKPQVVERDAATQQSQERLQKVLDARKQEHRRAHKSRQAKQPSAMRNAASCARHWQICNTAAGISLKAPTANAPTTVISRSRQRRTR